MRFPSTNPTLFTSGRIEAMEFAKRQCESTGLSLFSICLFVTVFACNVAFGGPFFADDFEDNDIRDGTPVMWSNGSGRYRPTNVDVSQGNLLVSEGGSVGSVGFDAQLGDAIFRTQFRFKESRDGGDFVGIFARDTGDDCESRCGNFWGGISRNGHLHTGTSNTTTGDNGWHGNIIDLGLRPYTNDVILELETVGSRVNLTAWNAGSGKPSRPQHSFSDGRFAQGGGGLLVQGLGGSFASAEFRYFQVMPLLDGDFDGNGSLDESDLDSIVREIAVPTNNGVFDVNGDANVDHSDVTQWLSNAATHNGFGETYLAGDSNLDGTVNSADLNNVGLNWQQNVARWSDGDFNADGKVNSADLNALGLNWQHSIPLASAAAAPVPEPSAMMMIVLAGLASVWRRTECC